MTGKLQHRRHLRPVDLARRHGLSAQAVRNYEQQGVLPPAARSASGYRGYTAAHAAALDAFLTLAPAHGHAAAREILRAVNRGDLPGALRLVDAGHLQLQRDRATLAAVEAGAGLLAAGEPLGDRPPPPDRVVSVGELAHRLGVSPATLRSWERAGILRPARDPYSGRRGYGADDVRDAELAHLLRRGGHLLAQIATVVDQVRAAGGTSELAAMIDGWRDRLTARGIAMLHGAAALAGYLDAIDAPAATGAGGAVGGVSGAERSSSAR
jgi:DNA-binding transcriptional MerR regulator